jgi:hypothetical protein
MRLSVFAVFLSTAAAAPALAGTVITSEISTPDGAGKLVEYIEADRVRIESPGNITIFRADQNIAYALVPAEKKFMRMTPETMKLLAAAGDAAFERLKSMPPEQRAQFEKMLTPETQAQVQKMMAGEIPQVSKFEFRKAGGTASFGKWTCERVEMLINSRPHTSLCVVRISDLGLTEEDFGAMRRHFAFRRQGMPLTRGGPAAGVDPMEPGAIDKVVGYPAYAVHVEDPAAKIQSIETVEKKALAADLFEVPADYREIPAPR